VPPSLNWDEVSHGYNAYSILASGQDEWGVRLPTIFRAYGDYKLPAYIYLTTIPIALFGPGALAVRLVGVLAGLVTILVTYLLTKELFKEKTALIAAFLVAVEPWSFFLSRGAFEANLGLTFFVTGLYLFILFIKKQKYLPFSILFFGLSVWAYNSYRIFTPLMLGSLFFIYKDKILMVFKKRKIYGIASIAIALVLFVPMVYQMISPEGQARYGWVSIIDEGAIAKINESRALSNLPSGLDRAVHNKGTYFIQEFAGNYLSHFTPNFMFIKGGSHYQFNLPGFGLLYPINALFILIGIVILIKERSKHAALLLSWLILAPVASSLTREAPHALRFITLLPLPMILASIGIVKTAKMMGKKGGWIIGAYLLLIAILAARYMGAYFKSYPVNYSWAWQYGYEEMIDYLKDNYDEYDQIIMTKKYGEPHEFILFFWPWDSRDYRNDDNLIRFFQTDWYWVDGFDKFKFVNDWDIPKEGGLFVLESENEVNCDDNKCLLVTSPGNYPSGWELVETITFLDGSSVFEIVKR